MSLLKTALAALRRAWDAMSASHQAAPYGAPPGPEPVQTPGPKGAVTPALAGDATRDLDAAPAAHGAGFATTFIPADISTTSAEAGEAPARTPAPPTMKPPKLTLARRPDAWPPERLSLALQGGGSFGAFAWGVLDRLLEEPDIEFDAVSGSSAGAVNAVLLASGMIDGGREGARATLSRFWGAVSQAAAMPQDSQLGASLDLIMRLMSPYQFNPFNLNPLREALAAEVDFERLRKRSKIKLLLGATRVRDGSLRILTNEELTVDAVLASACLPLLHHAIELDGEPYWDGGYAANPPLIPLVRASRSAHVLIVQVTPNVTERLPKTTSEIAARIEQIQFNATLNSEIEALKYAKIVGTSDKLRQLRIGRISADDHFEGFGEESARNLRWDFLERLRLGGRAAAELWLTQGLPALRRQA
jgi:NTE family protein